jgi:hypothetical protein
VLIISYARARLWIGISGVGLIVVACVAGISLQLPQRFLPTSGSGIFADLSWLAAAVALFAAIMAPLDLWGGYIAPKRFNQQPISLAGFLKQWSRGVIVQSLLFVASSIVILTVGRSTGLFGAAISIVVMSILYVAWQSRLVDAITGGTTHNNDDKVDRSLGRVEQWGLKRLPVTVIQNTDPGFTGGVLGLPWFESIIIPRNYVDELTPDQLAIVLGRRMIAIESGSRTRGIVAALIWIVTGFCVSASLPGAGVTSIAELATTCMGFTVWTFLGLLTLPTISRQSCYAIDSELLRRGANVNTFAEALSALDSVQDGEPSRGAFVETIFHPVPSVNNRQRTQQSGSPLAWHAARMTLFLSWSCMGLISRAVHCNVGRPELWAMLPTD